MAEWTLLTSVYSWTAFSPTGDFKGWGLQGHPGCSVLSPFMSSPLRTVWSWGN